MPSHPVCKRPARPIPSSVSSLGLRLLRAATIWFALAGNLAAQQELEIHHIDVGQGDATLIISPGGKTMLVDGGNNGKGASQVVPLLQNLGIKKLDFVIATHYDADHIGGLDEVLNAVPATIVYDHGRPIDKEKAKPKPGSMLAAYIKSAGSQRREIETGQKIPLGENIDVRCVAVNGAVAGLSAEHTRKLDENACSVALHIRYGGFDYFIGGDLTGGGKSGSRRTADVEGFVASVVGDVDVLHANHHGSETSSNEQFLKVLKPEVVIISVGNGGVNKRYHHPSRSVLDRLHEVDSLIRVFQTNRGETVGGFTAADRRLMRIANGNIVITTNGRRYLVNGTAFDVDERSQ